MTLDNDQILDELYWCIIVSFRKVLYLEIEVRLFRFRLSCWRDKRKGLVVFSRYISFRLLDCKITSITLIYLRDCKWLSKCIDICNLIDIIMLPPFKTLMGVLGGIGFLLSLHHSGQTDPYILKHGFRTELKCYYS